VRVVSLHTDTAGASTGVQPSATPPASYCAFDNAELAQSVANVVKCVRHCVSFHPAHCVHFGHHARMMRTCIIVGFTAVFVTALEMSRGRKCIHVVLSCNHRLGKPCRSYNGAWECNTPPQSLQAVEAADVTRVTPVMRVTAQAQGPVGRPRPQVDTCMFALKYIPGFC
jgi:hypothetical protein